MLLGATVPTPMPIRLFISGSAPLPMQTLKEFEEKFGVPLIEGYGLSEASPVVSKNPLHGIRKAGSIGIPVANVEMSIQDDSGKMLGANETGEICVRGGNVMQGYWNQPEETAKAFRDRWLLTGDVGYRDTDGYYYITDRKKDMLLVNGIKRLSARDRGSDLSFSRREGGGGRGRAGRAARRATRGVRGGG